MLRPDRVAGYRVIPDGENDACRCRDRHAAGFENPLRDACAAPRENLVIRLEADSAKGGVRIKVSDNSEALGETASSNGNTDYLAWSLDRKVRGARLALVQTVVEHFKGKWKMKTRPGQGNETVIVLPAS